MKRVVGIAFVFSIVYAALFSTSIHREEVLVPLWAQDLSNPAAPPDSASQDRVGFRAGGRFGYASTDGAIEYLSNIQFGLAMDENRFINFSSVPQNLVVKDENGRIVSSIESSGYPLLESGRFIVITTDKTALSEIDAQGQTAWSRDLGSIITCLDVTPRTIVAGLLDGTIHAIAQDGSEEWAYAPGGSRIPAIYGCAISSDETYVGVLSGLDPQRLILLARRAGAYQPTKFVNLDGNVRHRVFLHFFDGVPFVFAERDNGLLAVPLGSGPPLLIAAQGERIVDVRSVGAERLLVASASLEVGGSSMLQIVVPPSTVAVRLTLPGNSVSVQTVGTSIYASVGPELARVDFAER